jgi:2-C-methyl-D-erythritol 4-phosphate cytidylyltransferase
MSQSVRLWAVVPAAGSGTRCATKAPKQYLALNGKPLISHVIDTLLDYSDLSGVVVSVAENDARWAALHYRSQKLTTVTGGDTRMQSVLNAVLSLQTVVDPNDWVLVHDAARPGLTVDLLDRLLSAIKDHPVGGLLGIPAADTLKRVNLEGEVVETVPRERIWCAQTPQVFRYQLLCDALQAAQQAGTVVTDEASAVESLGHRPVMVSGCPQNFKVTTESDYQLMCNSFLGEEEV